MIIGLTARLCCNICCFLYPAYASYKALSLPESSVEGNVQVERWLMYWSVIGAWAAAEGVAGWLFTWLPFYSLVKFAFFLYLALPQTEGSTYIYRAHLAPIFAEHERDIDSFLSSLRGRASTTLAGGIGWLWEKVRAQLNMALPETGQGQNRPASPYDEHQQYAAGMHQPPSLQDPASGSVQQLYGLMSKYAGRYAPIAISALSAAASSATSRPAPANRSASGSSIAEQVPETMSMPIPKPNAQASDPNLRSRTYLQASGHPSSSSSARMAPRHASSPVNISQRGSEESISTRSSGNGSRLEMSGYEQINRDEAVEGYTVGAERPGMQNRRSSWFGWGGGGSPSREKVE